MKKFYIFLSYALCSLFSLFFFFSVQGQTAKDWVLGSWNGYISIDSKPTYKVSILSGENEDKTFGVDIYYYPFTKNGDPFRQDSMKMVLNEFDTSGSFDIAIPKINGGDYCKGKVTVKRSDLYTMNITANYQSYQPCQQSVALFLNDFKAMSENVVYKNAPDVDPKTNTSLRNDVNATSQQDTAGKNPSVNTNQVTFKINPKDVTHPADKDFKWYEWSKAPKDIIAASHFIHMNNFRDVRKDEILFDEVQKYLADKGTQVRIAAIDLDNDGVLGLAINVAGSNYCGTMGCTFEFYDNGGLTSIDGITDHGPSPDKNRVKASTGDYYSLRSNKITVDKTEITRLFTYTPPATVKAVAPSLPANILGGSTPDELGKLLLKALQTNNKKLWESCMHPTYDTERNPDHRKFETDKFEYVRSILLEKGLVDWKKVSFRRVTTDVSCQQCAPPGEKFLSQMYLEFWYDGKKSLGSLGFAPVITYKGKYFVAHYSENDFEPYSER